MSGANRIVKKVFNENAVIFEEGGSGDLAYMVMSGEISIYKNMRREAPIQLARLYKGDIFGETALYDDSPLAASAEAIRLAVRKS